MEVLSIIPPWWCYMTCTTTTFHCDGIRDPNNSHGLSGVEFTKSVDAMTTPDIRFTASVNATILLAFGPRNPWTQRELWHSVHGIHVYNPGLILKCKNTGNNFGSSWAMWAIFEQLSHFEECVRGRGLSPKWLSWSQLSHDYFQWRPTATLQPDENMVIWSARQIFFLALSGLDTFLWGRFWLIICPNRMIGQNLPSHKDLMSRRIN
jgi:hypothetical protein